MTDKYRNKYRITSHRMPKWDYSGNGRYFITMVTQNRECNLGQINNGDMVFSDFGKIVNNEWLKSFEIRDELFLDEYIIMPNHLHAIVILDKNGLGDSHGLHGSHGSHVAHVAYVAHGSHDSDGSHGSPVAHGSHVAHVAHVETHGRASLQYGRASLQSPQ